MKNEYSKIKAVASDLDGTLIKNMTNTLPKDFCKTVQELHDRGILFIAASGRQYFNMRRIFTPVVDDIDYIAENGCLAFHKGKLIYQNSIPRDLAFTLIADLQAVPGTEIYISGVKCGYVVSKNEDYVRLLRDDIGMVLKEIDDVSEIHDDIVKISILWRDGIPKEPEQYFHKKYDDRLSVANGGNGWLDFNNLGSGKGAALKVLAKHYHLSTDEIMVFGDNENDISMLKEAGISYTVNSATPYVKSFSDYSCDDVVPVLKKAFLS